MLLKRKKKSFSQKYMTDIIPSTKPKRFFFLNRSKPSPCGLYYFENFRIFSTINVKKSSSFEKNIFFLHSSFEGIENTYLKGDFEILKTTGVWGFKGQLHVVALSGGGQSLEYAMCEAATPSEICINNKMLLRKCIKM